MEGSQPPLSFLDAPFLYYWWKFGKATLFKTVKSSSNYGSGDAMSPAAPKARILNYMQGLSLGKEEMYILDLFEKAKGIKAKLRGMLRAMINQI